MGKLVLKSEQQILGDMARKILANTGLNDLNPGSVLLTLLQAAAQEDYAQYYQMLQIVRNYNLDTTYGTDLDNRAFEYGLTRKAERATTGKISILREAGFTKIATSFYTGFRSRIAGDTELFVNNAAGFPTSGSTQTLIIGRGTPNEEEITYNPSASNPEDNTNYFKITLTSPLLNDHSLEEEVVLKQGVDIAILAGSVVRVPASARSQEISFTTTSDVTLLAGEEKVENVDVRCNIPGIIGNVSANAIDGFISEPFVGARAVNESAFSNGQDRENDSALRSRIKSAIQAISQSTPAGIKNAINGLVDAETSKRVVSSNVILPDNSGEPVKIYIDDGTGFEPSFKSQGEETIIEAAQGGEARLQLDLFPLVKAQLETLTAEPYDFSTNGLTLQFNVGNESETITFFTNDFTIPEAVTAEEVVSAINNKSLLLDARTSDGGKKLVITSKSDSNEGLQITGGTANAKLGFPTDLVTTFYLYKNDVLLSKDGETAVLVSSNSAPFDCSGVDKELEIIIDGKTANPQTVTISESDFASPAAASQASAAQIAEIINNQLAGAVASDANGKVRLVSNTKLSASSKLKVNAGVGQTLLGFSTTEVVGKNQDYKLNPELGVIQLTNPLVLNDKLTAGTRNTRAFLTPGIPGEYTLAGGETLVVKVDGGAPQTVTFSAGTYSAEEMAEEINAQLAGAKAVTRTIGLSTYVEVRTNTLNPTVGSIEIDSSSTSNAVFEFDVDVEKVSITPHTAYSVSGASGPFVFTENQTLVVVLDNDLSGKTYIITMDYDSEVSSGTSTTIFTASTLTAIFAANSNLPNFWVVFKSGGNSTTGEISSVTNPSAGVFRYFFTDPPANYQDFTTGDQLSVSGMQEAANDGNFIITGRVTIGTVHSAVLDKDLSNPTALTPSTGDRYLVAVAAGTTTAASVLDKDISNPSALTPSNGDKYIVAAGAGSSTLDPVLDLQTDPTDPGVTAAHGNRYLIAGTGVGDWAGHDQEIAEYNSVGTPGWIFYTPVDGDVVLDQDSTDLYQFSQSGGIWTVNDWGGNAGKVATWGGASWSFTTPTNGEVRDVTDESLLYQYSSGSNTWTRNDWGGSGNKIAAWNGSAWTFTTPSNNDTVLVTDESKVYQYVSSAWSLFNFWVSVANDIGVVEENSTGAGVLGQRRQVNAYNASTGQLTVGSAFRAIPAIGDDFVLIPSTKENINIYFNNSKVTSLSSKADVELVEGATKIQISSKEDGSDGYVQVTGGKANEELDFSTSLFQGLRAYSYYTGLVKLVHRVIYSDETDLSTFPGVGAAGIKFQILAPTIQEVSFSLELTLREGVSFSSIENDAKSAVIQYVNGLGVSETVILSRIVERVLAIGGVIDVVVTSPEENIDIAENELARTKASLISIN